jgi:hypothetical protein
MKPIILLFLLSLFSSVTYAQESNYKTQTRDLVNWLIKQDKIKLLNEDIDNSTQPNSLSIPIIYPDSLKTLKQFLTKAEIQKYKQTKQRKTKSKWFKYNLDVDYYNEKLKDTSNKIIYGLSIPIFLNKACTRVLTGEYFICGIACGRGDLLLCELKDGKWTLIARGNVWNS